MAVKGQGSLFAGPEAGAGESEALSLNVRGRLKEAMRRTCKESRFSRPQIADRMNAQAVVEGIELKRPITTAAIEGWLAASKANLPDLDLAPLFCWAAGKDYVLDVLEASRGRRGINAAQARLLTWAEKTWQKKDLERQIRQLEPEV